MRTVESNFTLGARIRAARVMAGYSKPDDLSDELKRRGVTGLGRTVLYAMEADREPPKSIPVLREIAEACGLPLEWFSADFSRLAEISAVDPRQTLLREIAEAVERSRARREGIGEESQPPRAEGGES